jgi:hypothetical protein
MFLGSCSGLLIWSVVIGAVVTITGFVVWLIGLMVAVRDIPARERADVIRAYATCRPFRTSTDNGRK